MNRLLPCFVLLTVGLSLPCWLLINQVGAFQQVYEYGTYLMWVPGLAALLTLRLCRQPLSVIGWSWPAARYLGYGYLIPLVYVAVGYGLIWLSGFGHFPKPGAVQNLGSYYKLPTTAPWAVLTWHGLVTGSIGVLGCCINTLGEEIGWRGLLVPLLYRRLSYVQTSCVSGLLWAGWHAPLLFFADYNNGPGAPLWLGASCFTVLGMLAVSYKIRHLEEHNYSTH